MRHLALLPAFLLAACASPSLQNSAQTGGATEPAEEATPQAQRTAAPDPSSNASTPDELDTTTEEERAAATADSGGGGQQLGTTLATLGSPNESGIWLKTPLVGQTTPGTVTYEGETINVELRPSGGAAGSGSQISLPAMRLLGVSLTEIVELSVATR